MSRFTIEQWYAHVKLRSMAHEITALFWERCNNIVGFLAILSGVIAGYEVTQKGTPLAWWVIVLGVFAVVAAASNAAVKFFGFENRQIRHTTTAARYAALQYEIESILLDVTSSLAHEIYSRIAKELADIDKEAPLISESALTKARNRIDKQAQKEIPKHFRYDIELTENWILEEGALVEIGDNPVRSYDCEPMDVYDFPMAGKISVVNRHTMTRDGNQFQVDLEGDGIMGGDVAFIRYSVRNIDTNNVTYGAMVLDFTNRVEAKGCWMTARVKGADFLIGTIKMRQWIAHLEQQGTA